MGRQFAVLSIAVFGLAFLSSVSAADITPSSRMAIIRGLTAEYAALKVSLPRGEHGLRLKSSGEIEHESLQKEITRNGTAVPPNVLVQITAIEFRDKEISFEINGGGKKKTKWYEHIEVGIGYGTHPISSGKETASTTGSLITLLFPHKLPDMTVAEVKEYLGTVLDFNPVTALPVISKPVPPEFQEALQAKRAVIGMDRDMVLAAMGSPDHKVRETKDGVEREDWIYGTPPLKVIFVTFEDEKVIDVQEYVGGVRGATEQPYPEEPPR